MTEHTTTTPLTTADIGPSVGVRIVTAVLYMAFAAATGALAWYAPLAGDDFEAVRIARANPTIRGWAWFWYSHLFGRLPAILAGYGIVRSNALFAVLAGLTLPALAFLVAWLGLGRRPARDWADAALVALLTLALWFSLPNQWGTFWRSGWPSYSLSALLALAVLIPYRSWLANPSDARHARAGGGPTAVGLFALGIAAGSASEAVLGVLVVLAIAFVWAGGRSGIARRVPLRLWAGLAGVAVGGSLLLLAPGNRVRAGQTGDLKLALSGHVSAVATLAERTLFIWLMPAYPWLLVLALLATAAAVAGPSRPRGSGGSTAAAWIALAAGAIALVPVVAFPEVADFAGERVVFFTVIALFVAATSLLAPDGNRDVLARLPRNAVAAGLAILLLAGIGDVGVNLRYARAIDAALQQRATYIAGQRAAGVTSVTVPRAGIGEVGTSTPIRALVWGDIGADPTDWLNRSIATYYGVASIATTQAGPAAR